jgi:hypothetical protein
LSRRRHDGRGIRRAAWSDEGIACEWQPQPVDDTRAHAGRIRMKSRRYPRSTTHFESINAQLSCDLNILAGSSASLEF